jgi:phosphonate transport system ATP-binding protein
LFELDNASASYNKREVLSGVTLKIAEGERVALVGESGAGKSTLLALLYRQQSADSALIPQDWALVRTLSVFHNVYIGRLNRYSTWYNLRNLVRPSSREIDAIEPILESLGLADKIFAPVGELSGGQQQRAAVARALFQGSPALLGDEPVSAVDEYQARRILETIRKTHSTIVLAMHDVSLALAYTDRVIGIRNGGIVLDKPTAGLSRADLDPVYRA